MGFRIASGQGFYGEDVTRALPLIEGGHADVVCFEALSEVTLAILQKDRLADPKRGYTFDVRVIAERLLPAAHARGITLITNGGGLNPQGAAALVAEQARAHGLSGLRIASVTGDDVLGRLGELSDLLHAETQEPLRAPEDTVTANAYLGAGPIVEALNAGANLVVTGRVADACLFLAPLVAHFGWAWDDWDRLAAGIVAGHLLECTGQVVGGNSLALLDEISADDLVNLGLPIAEVEENGDFVLQASPGSRGRVTVETVKEQLLYEVHDPRRYLTPDVVVDFSSLSLQSAGPGRVRVSGARGQPRPERLKLNLCRLEGYQRELVYTIGYPQAWRKAELLQGMIRKALADLPIERIEFSHLGLDALAPGLAERPKDPLELILRTVMTAAEPKVLKSAFRRLMALGLSGPAGISLSKVTVGAAPSAVIGLIPALVQRDRITPRVDLHEVGAG